MEPDKRPEEITQADSPPLGEKEPFKPASRSTRIKAWIGVAAMVLLTLGYFYIFYSGQVINW